MPDVVMADEAGADPHAADPLSAVFFALADPTRRAILARLTDGPASVGDLAAPFAVSLATVSRHIALLERAGLVGKERNAQWRTVHLESARLRAADDWLAPYRAFFERRFDALEAHLGQGAPTQEERS